MENQKALKRMRTITEALNMIKEADHNTSITYYAIKKLCLENKITYIRIGNKIILNYDELLECLKIN